MIEPWRAARQCSRSVAGRSVLRLPRSTATYRDFTSARMARNYVSAYRRLWGMGKSSGEAHSSRPRQLNFNGGNGFSLVSIEKPLPALFDAAANAEISV